MTKTADMTEQWRDYLARDRRRSAHTIRAYVTTAQRFCAFLADHKGRLIKKDDFSSLSTTDLRSYLAFRRHDGLSNNSTARELSALRGFLKFVTKDDQGLDGDIPGIKGPKVTRGVPRPVAPDDILAMADDIAQSASEPWVAARDWAVLLLLYGAGLRISEALDMAGDALPLSDVLRVTGKRAKTRIVPLLPQVKQAIESYVALCPHDLHKDAPLFRGKRGGPLSANIIRKLVQAARTKLGLSDSATPHALRHSFATHLLAGGADLRSLQELLGHASLTSTQVYTQVDAAHLLDVYQNAHPRAR